jgi:hypothetical protein
MDAARWAGHDRRSRVPSEVDTGQPSRKGNAPSLWLIRLLGSLEPHFHPGSGRVKVGRAKIGY